jgi:hypothetical protein
MSAICCSSSLAFYSLSSIICLTLAYMVMCWHLTASIYFCFCKWLFLMQRARNLSWSSTEMPRTLPSSMMSSAFGVKPGGVAQGNPLELHVRTVPSGVGGLSWRGLLLLTASSSKASWGMSSARASLPFFSARRAAFATSSMEVVAFEVAFLGGHRGNGFSRHERWAPNVGTYRHVVKLIQIVGVQKWFDTR